MTWARFEDSFWSHPKTLRAGNEAVGVFVRIVCYCAQHLTDGAVDAGVALSIAGRQKPLDRLVTVGLLERDDEGYSVHGYLERNPSRAQVEADRAARTQRQNRWRSKQGSSPESAPIAGKAMRVDASTAPSHDASLYPSRDALRDDAPSRPVPSRMREREDTSKPSPETDTPTLALAAPETDPKTGARAPSAHAEVHRVFDHWRERLDHKGAKLDGKREALIRRALKSHGLAVVTAAVDGCAASEWHRGANPDGKRYDSLGLILRDAEHIERFASMATPTREGTASASGGGVTGVRPSAPTLAAHRPAVAPQLPTVGAPLTRPAFLRRTAEPVAATQTAEEDMPW